MDNIPSWASTNQWHILHSLFLDGIRTLACKLFKDQRNVNGRDGLDTVPVREQDQTIDFFFFWIEKNTDFFSPFSGEEGGGEHKKSEIL